MLPTYQGVLRSNHIEWLSDAPEHISTGQAVRVYVTLLESSVAAPALDQGRRMVAALEKLAALPVAESLSDPVEWQREIRQDRTLPGRED